MSSIITIGTRGSKLALWQANYAKKSLRKIGINCIIKVIQTKGDKIKELSFDKIEGKGFFIKEIEEALLKKQIDLAVHSYKDLPTTQTKGLVIAAVSKREDPSECLLISPNSVDLTKKLCLKKGAVVGTSSSRRKSQLLAFRNDITLKDIRGNVPTRIKKLKENLYDAILIAYAGVKRLKLNLSDFHSEIIHPTKIIPAPAQGVIAYQIRETDVKLRQQLKKINCLQTEETSYIERKILNLFEGGCQLPLGVYCNKDDSCFHVWTTNANSSNVAPIRVYYKSKNVKLLISKSVSKIRHIKPKTVFITRELESMKYFSNCLSANGYKVHGKSLIEITQIPFNTLPQTEWIFFSSKNGVEHFFNQNPDLTKNVKFATIGKGTASAVKQFGKTLSFIGDNSSTIEVAKSFSKLVRGKTVLFPGAKNGIRTVQKTIKNDVNKVDLFVYETNIIHNVSIPKAEIMVFTSPSNVSAYFIDNKISKTQSVVAIGETTAKKLKSCGCKNIIISQAPDEFGLTESVFLI